ncbi:MAG TPA: Xaa-Pro peptidase family protein, partial [Anaerolineaceae bacterium]|nr:Xaa-Pro peptidase family protein [Anaerolineaceae bacterium]
DPITALRQVLANDGLDAAFISSSENWRYFSGFTGSHAYLVITADRQILVTDPRYTEQATAQAAGWQVITHGLDPLPALQQALQASGARRVGYETHKLSDHEIRSLRAALPEIDWQPAADHGKRLRAVKSPAEQAAIHTAVEIADRALADLLPLLRPGVTEREVAVELEYRLARNGSEGPSFGTIVAAGERGALPHAAPSERTLNLGDMVVVDFGAVYRGYHSDITRTLWVGEPALRLREIFAIVEEAQQAAIAAIRPGATGGEVDEAHRTIFRRCGVEEFALRGLGHGVGLEIHEQPRVVMGSDEQLEIGMVFTVEPGLYLPGTGGVRTEDIVCVTPAGCEVWTRSPHLLRIPAASAAEGRK